MKKISSDKVIYTFKPKMEEVEKVLPDEIFQVETNDCFYGQIKKEEQLVTEVDFSRINPATGPIYVENAEPGDILKVEILDIELPEKGVIVTVPGEGILGEMVERAKTNIIEIDGDFCYFNGLKIPVTPMIGVIGVAPSDETGEYPTGSPWKHGGNMDTKDITVGSIVYFPVNQPGALLALGDCHAVMGDGEVCVAGCEINSKVTLKVNLIKRKKIEWPIVETKDSWMIVASGKNLEEASKEAVKYAVKYLETGLKISWDDAYMLSSMILDLKISQVVDPNKTVRAVIPKSILSLRNLFEKL
ncbi:MAG: amidase [Thermotogaceae bacterium]|nr:amidase [Thermotogaceae bacterium]MDN5338119.1 amidase [Thermotogaceae bacterium]